MVCVLSIAVQTVICLSDYLRTISATWNVEDTTGQYCVTQPITAESCSELAVNSITKCDLEAAQQRKYLLRQVKIQTVKRHSLSCVVPTCREVSAKSFCGENMLKICKFHVCFEEF